MLDSCLCPEGGTPAGRDDGLLQLVRLHRSVELAAALRQALMKQGLQRFVAETVAPLAAAVGEAWMRGEFEVFEEHLYTEQMQSLLRQAISALPVASRGPRVVLTTVPEEQHVLGLLMSECLLTLEGATCIPLGTQTPLADIVRAASAHAADVVALSFSAAFPSRQVLPLVSQLRAGLPPAVALWLGGGGSERLRCAPDGVRVVP